MEGYKRISEKGRVTLAEAEADCAYHVGKGRKCRITRTPTGKYLAHVAASRGPRQPVPGDLDTVAGAKRVAGAHRQGGHIVYPPES